MCYPLEIKFRPSVSQDYTDRVEIFTKRGSFSVALESLLPYLDCRIDSALDFGFCPVKEVAERTITVTNTGTKQFQFKWTSEVPFNIEPHVGKLEPGQSATSKVCPPPLPLLPGRCCGLKCDGDGERRSGDADLPPPPAPPSNTSMDSLGL